MVKTLKNNGFLNRQELSEIEKVAVKRNTP